MTRVGEFVLNDGPDYAYQQVAAHLLVVAVAIGALVGGALAVLAVLTHAAHR